MLSRILEADPIGFVDQLAMEFEGGGVKKRSWVSVLRNCIEDGSVMGTTEGRAGRWGCGHEDVSSILLAMCLECWRDSKRRC